MDRSGVSALLRQVDVGSFPKLLIATAGSLAAWGGVLSLARLVNRREGRWEGEVFVAGTMSLVWMLALLVTALVGWKNFEICAVVSLAAGCVTVLQVFVGLTRISGIEEPRATLAVPLILIAGVWLTKIIFTAIFG